MFLGKKQDGNLILDADKLTTHTAVFGATGSGKTGLIIGIVEELIKLNTPVILVDIKGDMINVALQDKRINVQCLTPGATHGEAVNVLADLDDPIKASTVISAILSMLGEDPDPLRSKEHAFLSAILCTLKEKTLFNLVENCIEPDVVFLGALTLEDAFPSKQRTALARKLNVLLTSPSFKIWRLGMDLEIDNLIESKGITIFSVAHLVNQYEQNFAISFLLNELLRWVRIQSGSTELRLALVIDECVGLLPPAPLNPATKEPLMLLLKQARAFGVGCILATQNPVDIDYKAMSNCNTWFVGRMTAERDRARVVSGMVSAGVGNADKLNLAIAGLQPRQFVMARVDEGAIFTTKDVSCDLKGPMVPSEIKELYEKGYITYDSFERELIAARVKIVLDDSDQNFKRVIELQKQILLPIIHEKPLIIEQEIEVLKEVLKEVTPEEIKIPIKTKQPLISKGEIAFGIGLILFGWWFVVHLF